MKRKSFFILFTIILIVLMVGCDASTAANTTANNAVAAPAVNNSTGNNVAAAANTAVSTAPEPATDVASTANSTEDTTADTTNDTLNTTNQTAAAPATTTTGTLTEDEIDSLTFMREEEKLAHDVYVTLYDMWGSQVFINIAASEQTHTDTILGLLELYNLPDPAVGNDIGVFTNTTLQNLYDQLISQGSQSLLEALRVGAAIEEIDIIDLENRLATTTNYDITTAYQNLLSGSENHLRSFVSTIERQVGEVYTPQYLSQEAYDAILSGQTGQNGNGQSGDSGNGQQGSNGQGGQGQASTGQSTGGGKGYRGGRGNGNTTP